MHIPDGYLGPQTYVPLWGVMGLYWARASSAVRRTLTSARLPLLAIGAAFSFVIMMFNVPIPGGTTGHAVGAALVAILLGPWAASIAISVAVVVQALLFADGGITAIAANCLTMAVVGPWVAWWVYRALSRSSEIASKRRVWAAAVAAYVGLNASALATALLVGVQPALAHTPSGQPLYAPYPLWVAVPAIMVGHLLFGLVEAAVTALAVRWFQASDPSMLAAFPSGDRAVPAVAHAAAEGTAKTGAAAAAPGEVSGPGRPLPAPGAAANAAASPAPAYRRLWIALAVLALLTPLGLWVPSAVGGGSAWGEWSSQELRRMLGFVPRGLARLEPLWRSVLPGYAVRGLSGPVGQTAGYLLSAVAGITLVVALTWLLTKVLGREAR